MADQNGTIGNGGSTAGTTTGTSTTTQGGNLGEARTHLGKAASAAGDSLRGAARAARDELRTGTGGVRSELDEAAIASRAAAYEVRDLADEKLQEAMSQGRDLMDSAERMIREKPLQAIGIAALAGFLIAKLR